jgi:multidrug resistance efflux pump
MNEGLDELAIAREDLSRAEKEVDAALAAIRQAPRAEKTGVTHAVEEAFNKVREARLALEDLERLLAKGDG